MPPPSAAAGWRAGHLLAADTAAPGRDVPEGLRGNQLWGSESSPPEPSFYKQKQTLWVQSPVLLPPRPASCGRSSGTRSHGRCPGGGAAGGGPGPHSVLGCPTCWCLPKGLKVGGGEGITEAARPSAPPRSLPLRETTGFQPTDRSSLSGLKGFLRTRRPDARTSGRSRKGTSCTAPASEDHTHSNA